MSIQKDVLYTRATMQREFPDLDDAVARGEVCARQQFGIEEFWVNSRPEQNARILRTTSVASIRILPAVPAPSAAPARKQPAPVKKASRPVEVGPLGF